MPQHGSSKKQSLLLIYSSLPMKVIKSGTYDTGIADHCLIYTILKMRQNEVPRKVKLSSNVKNCNWEKFREEMRMAPWPVCSTFEDIDDCFWAWEKLYHDVRNRLISKRLVKIRVKTHPWLNNSLRKEMNKRY